MLIILYSQAEARACIKGKLAVGLPLPLAVDITRLVIIDLMRKACGPFIIN